MAQKWYQKATVQKELVAGLFIIAAAVIGYLASRSDTQEPPRLQPTDLSAISPAESVSEPPEESTRVFLREKSPNELFAALEKLPPLQAEEIIKTSYLGRIVKWTGIFSRARSHDQDNSISVIVEFKGLIYGVSVNFNESWRSFIGQLRQGDVVTFEAKIVEIHGPLILLDEGLFVD